MFQRSMMIAGYFRLGVILMALGMTQIGHAETVPFFLAKDLTPIFSAEDPRQELQQELATVHPFELVDQEGNRVTEADLRGHYSVVNFFFATCGGICPRMMSRMKGIQGELKRYRGLKFYSVTVTPELDTPSKLAAYAEKMKISSSDWHLLTGSRAAIEALAEKSFQAAKLPPSKKEGAFVHPDHLYLIDPQLRLRGIYLSSNRMILNHLPEDLAALANLR